MPADGKHTGGTAGPAVDPDAELMLRVQQGDRESFARLFDKYGASVVSFAFRFVKDRARAEELSQDVFLKLYRSANRYRPTARFKTFLFRITANHCLNELRRGEHKMELRSGAELPEEPGRQPERPDELLSGEQLKEAMERELSKLPPRERAALLMARVEGLSYGEIAEALDASEAAVKSLIHRATVALARAVEPLMAGEAPAAIKVGGRS